MGCRPFEGFKKSGTMRQDLETGETFVATTVNISQHRLILIAAPTGFTWDWDVRTSEIDESARALELNLARQLEQHPYRALLQLGFKNQIEIPSESVQFFHRLARSYVKHLVGQPDLEQTRQMTSVPLSLSLAQHLMEDAPYGLGAEHINPEWVEVIWHGVEAAFQEEIAGYIGSVADYFEHAHADLLPLGRVFFHLVESKDEAFPFAFLATYASDSHDGTPSRHVPLKNALVEYQAHQEALLGLLSTVSRAARTSPLVSKLLESGEIFHPLRLTSDEAYTFLQEVPLYEAAGIFCRIPKWWRTSRRLRVHTTIGAKTPAHLGSQAILDFQVQIAMGEDSLTLEEIQYLLQQTEGLAFLKGKWVEVDHAQLGALLKAYETARQRGTSLTLLEALRFELAGAQDAASDSRDPLIEIHHGEWLRSLLERNQERSGTNEIALGTDFKATLRDYQKRGVEWLAEMRDLGLGACLADDMGLGKTVQVLAWLSALRQTGPIRALLVVPASLLGNWMDEMAKFAPNLRGYLLHPSVNRGLAPRAWDTAEVIVTTYGMLQKLAELRDPVWDVVVLDEAQAIKNPSTKQARTVKELHAIQKIALTGTPIENRLSDLWSLFDFLNRGLLGSAAEFTQFTKALVQHPEGYAPLKRVVTPFILRRLKTDKAVIADLPDKIETTSTAILSRRQAALYLEVVEDVARKIQNVEGIERRGLILASLMKLKQICNHPDQYLGQQIFDPAESGKFSRLEEIVETIREKRERVLVFTQFKEMTEPLSNFLAGLFQRTGLVLHGGTAIALRRDLVAKFQGPDYVPFMVLSLKAGGVGLNLTAANHVIHFDRWWNPAVENQATDRAFRIGQQKGVMVHKFVTKGTIEEKIDRLIQDKLQLSQEIIASSGETWIGDLDNQDLMELLTLNL